ncbi:MAG TPA: RecX family transcriptional regulator [Candidatus Dormibacteraeota bacterium]|nr:RecX family transcriptional regulator [Candidatus Dormibacteraeota bacterium]
MPKITKITPQIKRPDRYSIFIDGQYTFSLHGDSLLEAKLVLGLELNGSQLAKLKKTSSQDRLYSRTLRYAALRKRSLWEIKTYLERKDASPALINIILNKLSNIGIVDDEDLARALVADRQLLRPTSRLKLISDLRHKHISEEIIQRAVAATKNSEQVVLKEIIERKRQQSKYQDDLKLMQYLARQGFKYQDIKQALAKED